MRINFDFSDLEAFLTVQETGSFHLAAERLNLSQSAVTRRVQKLEGALDTLLFERSTRSVRPTLAAKRLRARAEAILADAAETTAAMRDESVSFAHQRNAIITIATIPSVAAGLLPPALKLLHAQGHAARVRLLDFAANEVAEAVAQGEADFGISSIPTLEPNTSFEPLFDDPIELVLPAGHKLAGVKAGWKDLVGQPLILPMQGTGNRLLIDEAMARARQPLTWTYEVRRSSTALDLVAGGVGVALLPASALNARAQSGLTSVPIGNPGILRAVGLLSRIGHRETPVVAALKHALRTAIPRGDDGPDS